MKIQDIHARQILDSKGDPTIETDVMLEDNVTGRSSIPSGASTGINEAVELRDNNKKIFRGKGVLKAVNNVNEIIKKELLGFDASDQKGLDNKLIQLDGTPNKGRLGANAILSVSVAACKAAAHAKKKAIYEYIGVLSGNSKYVLPRPLILMLEGGKHGNWATDIQEYMIIPIENAFPNFAETIRAGSEIFHTLEKILDEKKYSVGVGLEGAYCPPQLKSNDEAFELILEAIEKAGYKPKDQFMLAIDCASSEFYHNGKYLLKSEDNKTYSPQEWSDKIINLTKKYPIYSIEDPHAQDAWDDWIYLTQQIGKTTQIVGDDLLTTNTKLIQKAIEKKAVNSVLIKLNQIGTLTETLNAIALSKKAGFSTIVSHRSGETNDDFVADLVVGSEASQCRFGGPDRGERVAKYNQLLRIEEKLI